MKRHPKIRKKKNEEFKDHHLIGDRLYITRYSAKPTPSRGHDINGPIFQAHLGSKEIKPPKKNKKKKPSIAAGYIGATTRTVERFSPNDVYKLKNLQSSKLELKKFYLLKNNKQRVSRDLWEMCGRATQT